MEHLFAEMEKFGLENLSKQQTEVFQPPEEEQEKNAGKEHKAFSIHNYIYPKSYICSVCSQSFTSSTVRAKKVRIQHIDLYLHPICTPIEPLFYGVVSCSICGYTATDNCFDKITGNQARLIIEKISNNFRSVSYPEELDADMAIERYKLALLNAMVKQGKVGEKAYICMKLTWLYKIKKDAKNIKTFAELTVTGFNSALQGDRNTLLGLEESSIIYLLGAFSALIGEKDAALKYLSQVVVSKAASSRLKDKARDLKGKITKSTQQKNAQ